MAKEKRNVRIIADSRIERGVDDKESIIFSADGTIEDDGEKITVRYTEPGNEDTKATKNEISFLKERCGEVTISRRGGVNSLMMFKKGGRYNWQYDVGFMAIDLCTSTTDLDNTINYKKGGEFGVHYVMESNGIEMQKVRLTLTVK